MIWVIAIVAVFVIIGSLIDFLLNGWTLTTQFFIDSWYGIIAIITGILSVLMFYGSSKSYRMVKFNESFLPNFKNLKGEGKIMENEFDLSKLTMESLVKKMAFEMTKPGPVFFKGWGNRRLELDVERVNIIKNYIDSLRETGNSLMELQSDAVLSFNKIKILSEIKKNELASKLQKSQVDLDFVKIEYQSKIRRMSLENDNLEEDIKMKKALREKVESENKVSVLLAEAEYKLMIAKSEKDKEIALLLAEAVKYYKKLPNVLKSYVAVQLGSENSQNPNIDMELQEQLKDFIIRKHKAETEMLENEADENKALTDTVKVKLDREKKKYLGDGKV
jgi:hypothetical protein